MDLRVRPMRKSDRERVASLTAQAFNVGPSRRERLLAQPPEEIRVAETGGTVAGALRIHRIGHSIGGGVVPAAGIASVAVAPDARGRGIARALVGAALEEMRGAGVPFSSLYPATVPPYRQMGYEYAFTRTRYDAPLAALPPGGPLEVEPWEEELPAAVEEAYGRYAAAHSGPVARPSQWWRERILGASDQDVYRYLVREGGEVTGCIVYTQEQSERRTWRYDLACRELFWLTEPAARSLLGFAATHRSLADRLLWCGPPDDPLGLLTVEQSVHRRESFAVMGRLLDVPAALEARGYPPAVTAALTLAVDDPLLPSNAGPWRIEVSEGAASVAPAAGSQRAHGLPAAAVDVGTLAALYTGYLHPRMAERLGRLEGDAEAAEALEAIFAGPRPWLSDFF